MKLFISLLTFLALYTSVYSQQWVQTNGPGGDALYSIAVNSQGHIFVGSHSLHRSTDGGITWVHLFPDTLSYYSIIQKVFIQPSGILTLLLYNQYGYPGGGIYRSVDNGNSWTQISLNQKLFQGANGDLFSFSSDSLQLLRSIDDGLTWLTVSRSGISASNGYYSDITSDAAGRLFVCADYSYRSTDNGKSWSKLVNGVPESQGFFTNITVAPNGELFAYRQRGNYLFRSTDGGRIWNYDTTFNNYVNSHYSKLEFVTFNAGGDILLLQYEGVPIIYQEAGTVLRIPSNFKYSGLAAVPETSGDFLVITSDRLFRLSPNVLDPVDSFTIPNANVSAIIGHPSGNLAAFTTTYNSWYSTNQGFEWKGKTAWDVVNRLAVDSSQNLIGGLAGRIIRSEDSGKTWILLPSSLTNGTFLGIAVSFNGDIFAASTKEGIFRSSDNGSTWDQLNSGITDQHLYSLVLHPNRSVYAGGKNAIYRSVDGGFTWSTLNTEFPSNAGNVTALVVNSKGDIFAGVEKGGVHWSTDNGVSWQSRALGLTALNINALLATPGGNVLAATEQGVFILDSSKSASWKPYSDGLTAKKVQTLCIDRDGYIYAGTDASGVFRSTATFNTIVSEVKLTGNNDGATALGTNYPNPFSSSTTIPFSLAERSFITIEVLDALGRSVAQVASGVYEAGKYETKFDAVNVAAGTYFVRLRTERNSYVLPVSLTR